MTINLTLHLIFKARLGGETTVSHENLVWITKTHWPMESPMGADRFSAQKCISVVRNPIDTLPSLSLLALTLTHSKQLATPINEADPDWWNRFLTRTGKAINDCGMIVRQQV